MGLSKQIFTEIRTHELLDERERAEKEFYENNTSRNQKRKGNKPPENDPERAARPVDRGQ